MKIRGQIFIVVLILIFAGCVSLSQKSNSSFAHLPDLNPGHYKVTPYMKAAIELQSLDHETALRRLHAMAKNSDSDDQVIVLCRMLFTKRRGSDFRRPGIGGAFFLGGTDYSDWPLEPIELVDGIPFLITRGYMLAGFPEPGEMYLGYCETNCDWTPHHYTMKTERQKEEALSKLIVSPKWKRPLDNEEQKFLSKQIE
jgi:hypothetical protein